MPNLQDLPTELLLQITDHIRYRGQLKQQVHDTLVDHLPPAPHLFDNISQDLFSLSLINKKFRELLLPIIFNEIDIGSGGRRDFIDRIDKLFDILEESKTVGDVVEELILGPWSPGNLWSDSRYKSDETSLELKKEKYKRVASDVGLDAEVFSRLVDEGRPDMLFTIIIYCFPKIKHLQLGILSKQRPPYKASTECLELALRSIAPPSFTTLKTLSFKYYGPCGKPESSLVRQLFTFPNLEEFICEFGRRLSHQAVQPFSYNIEEINNDNDETGDTVREGAPEDYWSDEEDEWKNFIVDDVGVLEVLGLPATPKPGPKSSSITDLVIKKFATDLTDIATLIRAPQQLKILDIITSTIGDDISIIEDLKSALLSQRDSLEEITINHTDPAMAYILRQVLPYFKSLKKLRTGHGIFLDWYYNLDFPNSPSSLPNPLQFLPRNLEKILITNTENCFSATEIYLDIAKQLSLLSADKFPRLQHISLQVPAYSMIDEVLKEARETLKNNGIKFDYSFFEGLSTEKGIEFYNYCENERLARRFKPENMVYDEKPYDSTGYGYDDWPSDVEDDGVTGDAS